VAFRRRRGAASSRAEARETIERGVVLVGGRPASKASTMVGADQPVEVRVPARRFVSRAGVKLEAALDRFGIRVEARDALDAGASTGGFTDVLLRRGAARVAAVDVGYGQLAWSLRQDPRVTVLERTNVRALAPGDLPFAPSVVVADLSFISLRLVLPSLAGVTTEGGDHVLLVKPQFEAGRSDVGRGGVVRDPAVWRRAVAGVADAARDAGLAPEGVMASPLPGAAGNVEFLLWARAARAPGALDAAAIGAAVEQGEALARTT
jgi:23S rRNA (cytidine1920-2'-O)/16S rRNA (cytidine1409-2'-O)-methyltransferase